MSKTLPWLLFAVFACPAWADQVTLKNGDRVTGKIVKKEGASLIFKGDAFGLVTIPWDRVADLAADDPLTVVLADGSTVQGELATADSVLIVKAAERVESIPLTETRAIRNASEQKAWERLQRPGWGQLWSGSVGLGGSLARGNAETTTVTTSINAARETRTSKTSLYFREIYARATLDGRKSTTAQAVRGGWGQSRNVYPRLFISLSNDWEYDKFQSLDLRFVLGSGFGYIVGKTERTRLDLVGGAAYTHERFSTPSTRDSGSAYWGNDWNYTLTGNTALSQTFRMFNNLSETGESRVNFDAGTVTALSKWLSLQFTCSNRYVSRPQPGRKNNDVLLTTGLRISFAR